MELRSGEVVVLFCSERLSRLVKTQSLLHFSDRIRLPRHIGKGYSFFLCFYGLIKTACRGVGSCQYIQFPHVFIVGKFDGAGGQLNGFVAVLESPLFAGGQKPGQSAKSGSMVWVAAQGVSKFLDCICFLALLEQTDADTVM